MPIFPVLETEKELQINDKTRFDATRSFISLGETALSNVRIKSEPIGSYISVFNSGTSSLWNLDWSYSSFTIDIDSTNNKIDFKDGSGSEVTATLASGNYTLSALAAEIKTKMDTVGTLIHTVNVSNDTFSISAPSDFSLLVASGTNLATSIFSHIGFYYENVSGLVVDQTGKSIYTGRKVDSVVKQVTLEVTNGTPVTAISNITLYSESGDNLYSTDARLREHEPEIMKYLPKGKSTYKNIHRRAQKNILAYLDKEGFVDSYGNKYTKRSILDVEEVTEWSTYEALKLIYTGLSNATDDVFFKKASEYAKLAVINRERAVLRIDNNEDGEISLGEQSDVRSGIVVRR